MRTDRDIQEALLEELDWEPGIEATRVGASVTDGVVTLRGVVSTLLQKLTAERVARRILGVRAIANDLDVSPTGNAMRGDPAIAEAAANALEWDSAVPDSAVKATVRNGWVMLTGSVGRQFEKAAAEHVVGRLDGVKGVANGIVVKPQADAGDVKTHIENAFKRSAEIDAQRVAVASEDGRILLTGTVRSLSEHDEAERAAWAAPGVVKVDNRLVVVP